MNRIKQWYDRYLKGVCLARAAKTLLGYAALLYVALTVGMHATQERAIIATILATVFAVPVYLRIPKSAQALVDNIADELLSRQSSAAAIAAKLEAAIPVSATSDGTTTTATAERAPTTATAIISTTSPPPVQEAGAGSTSTPDAAATPPQGTAQGNTP